MWDDEQLKYRIKLFEEFCLPSVSAQTCKNFTWLVCFDSNSPDFLRECVKKYSSHSFFVPVFMEHFDQEKIVKIIIGHLDDQYSHVITSRLDNDDAVCKNYIETIQSKFMSQDQLFVNILNGFMLEGRKLYLKKIFKNPFISLIEKINQNKERIKTIFCEEHLNIDKVGRVIDVRDQPGWLIVIHGKNLANKRNDGYLFPIQTINKYFVIDHEVVNFEDSVVLCYKERFMTYISEFLKIVYINIRKFLMAPFRLLRFIKRMLQI
jgi:hypothetical protein